MWKNPEIESEIAGYVYFRKPVSLCYFKESDLEHISPSGCGHFSADVCKEWFVKEMQELENKKYNFFNETDADIKMATRGEKKSR